MLICLKINLPTKVNYLGGNLGNFFNLYLRETSRIFGYSKNTVVVFRTGQCRGAMPVYMSIAI